METPPIDETPLKIKHNAGTETKKQPSATLLAIQTCDALSDVLKNVLRNNTLGSPERKNNLIIKIQENIQILTEWLQNPANNDIEYANELVALTSLADADLTRNNFESFPAAIKALASIQTKLHTHVFSTRT